MKGNEEKRSEMVETDVQIYCFIACVTKKCQSFVGPASPNPKRRRAAMKHRGQPPRAPMTTPSATASSVMRTRLLPTHHQPNRRQSKCRCPAWNRRKTIRQPTRTVRSGFASQPLRRECARGLYRPTKGKTPQVFPPSRRQHKRLQTLIFQFQFQFQTSFRRVVYVTSPDPRTWKKKPRGASTASTSLCVRSPRPPRVRGHCRRSGHHRHRRADRGSPAYSRRSLAIGRRQGRRGSARRSFASIQRAYRGSCKKSV